MATETVNPVLKMKVFPKGQVVIPASIREKYNIRIGDQIDFIPSKDGILLKVSSTPDKIETRTDHLFGLFKKQARQRRLAEKEDIDKSTETEFVKEWHEREKGSQKGPGTVSRS
ncbi:MAG: AbrB/MazE/SpoVT family DNA-binding domain-containing protein [Desulfobacterales bacterium]|nr:AbrB/MazE/SpoVT family DNA-binding domain-containing protein [Desulfobacterales bacterium]